MAVKFLKKHQAYNAGEVAGFTPQKEAQLCREGFARPYVKGESAAAVADGPKRGSIDDPDHDPHAGMETAMETKQQTPAATGQTKPGKGSAGTGKGKSSR